MTKNIVLYAMHYWDKFFCYFNKSVYAVCAARVIYLLLQIQHRPALQSLDPYSTQDLYTIVPFHHLSTGGH